VQSFFFCFVSRMNCGDGHGASSVMVMGFLQAVRVVSQNPRGGMLALRRLAAGERSWLESGDVVRS
jgi:hypothetical protein